MKFTHIKLYCSGSATIAVIPQRHTHKAINKYQV